MQKSAIEKKMEQTKFFKCKHIFRKIWFLKKVTVFCMYLILCTYLNTKEISWLVEIIWKNTSCLKSSTGQPAFFSPLFFPCNHETSQKRRRRRAKKEHCYKNQTKYKIQFYLANFARKMCLTGETLWPSTQAKVTDVVSKVQRLWHERWLAIPHNRHMPLYVYII